MLLFFKFHLVFYRPFTLFVLYVDTKHVNIQYTVSIILLWIRWSEISYCNGVVIILIFWQLLFTIYLFTILSKLKKQYNRVSHYYSHWRIWTSIRSNWCCLNYWLYFYQCGNTNPSAVSRFQNLFLFFTCQFDSG